MTGTAWKTDSCNQPVSKGFISSNFIPNCHLYSPHVACTVIPPNTPLPKANTTRLHELGNSEGLEVGSLGRQQHQPGTC